VTAGLPPRPNDATLSVTKAARILGVHPNTIRAWSDQGRLRYYRINPRGDRRYRVGDLQGFLAAAEARPSGAPGHGSTGRPALTLVRSNDTAAARPLAARRRGDRLRLGPPTQLVGPDMAAERARHRLDLRVLAELAAITSGGRDTERMLGSAVALLRESFAFDVVAAFERRDDTLVARAIRGRGPVRSADLPLTFGAVGRSVREDRPILTRADTDGWQPVHPGSAVEIALPITAGAEHWGALVVGSNDPAGLSELDIAFLDSVARQFAAAVHAANLFEEAAQQVHRLDALRRVASDIGSKIDLDQTLAGLVDHATVLFQADRAAVFLQGTDGHVVPAVSRGLSPTYLAAVRDFPVPSLPGLAVEARRPMFATGYADDPRGSAVRAAVIQEGFDTICTAPLVDGQVVLGLLNVYHDRPHPWTDRELETLGAFASQAQVAIKTAQDYNQMATWAAQLQSIQQLGARLNGLTSVREIGAAIATELHQLIDYHNVRVYRLEGTEDLIPVAFQGKVGEYVDETPEQLSTKVGRGITGWVAEHRVAVMLPDAANDPRASTIAGTEEDLDESMLLAPMLFEDTILGVLVLSKLGLNQFSEDDLRLLVIYASFAAQAMANADTNERLREQTAVLERQLRSQRDLLQITESILGTLDTSSVLDQITDRLNALVRSDTIAIELVDKKSGLLVPLSAKGVHAVQYLEPWEPGEEGIAPWVVAHNEAQLIEDEAHDPRVNHFRGDGAVDGSIICVPLRDRNGAVGVLTLERLGATDRYSTADFDLVQLFAAHVSIALENAEAFKQQIERAERDTLTGLFNHGSFKDGLIRAAGDGSRFSLVMIDIDDFKAANDRMGHQAGDRLLQEIAGAIMSAGRESDRVFRYGGDEIALILPKTDHAGAILVAERIRSAVEAVGAPSSPWATSGLMVSVSIGVATFPDDGADPERILLAADRACFVAKRTGQGYIATAAQGLALAGEFKLQDPTPVDPPSVPA
jgi:diguanylate cyclase (GGDEF)-like protein/excisionase family DNA binding protein